MKRLPLFLVLIASGVLLLSTGCSTLHFTNPMPHFGMTIDSLPSFLEGTYIQKTDAGVDLMEIVFENDQHAQVFISSGFNKDSLNTLIAEARSDGDMITRRNGSYFIENPCFAKSKEVKQVGDYYFFSGDLAYDIKLTRGHPDCQLDWGDNEGVSKIRIRAKNGKYFLNIYEYKVWFTIVIQPTEEGLTLQKPEVKDSSLLSEGGKYDNLNWLHKQGDHDWISSPSDEELFEILEADDLFVSEYWLRISTNQPFNVGLLSLCIFLAVGFIMLAWDLIRKRN